MTKYYTPKLEELVEGFDCEIMTSYGWVKGTYPEILREESLNNFGASIEQQTNQSSFRAVIKI